MTERAWLVGASVPTLAALLSLGGCASPEPAASAAANPSAQAPAAALDQAGRASQATPTTGMTFDGARAWAHLERQVRFGPRPAGSPALAETRQYLIAQLKEFGVDVREQAFVAKTPAGDVPMVNVTGTIRGRRTDRIVLASHYDTKRAPFRFVGANDGASSTAVLLELSRALAGSQPELTLEFLFLDGEEAVNWEWAGTDNTYGSRHYVATAQQTGTLASLKALVLLDMVGDAQLLIRRESMSTPWLVDLVWAAAGRLGHRAVFSNELTTVEDDHVPFLRAGVAAVDIIDLDTPTWHTAQDDLPAVSQRSLQVVGDVVLAALPDIQQRLTGTPGPAAR